MIELYSFEDKDGHTLSFLTRDMKEARDYARENGLKWFSHRYGFSDTQLMEDYTQAVDLTTLLGEWIFGDRESVVAQIRGQPLPVVVRFARDLDDRQRSLGEVVTER